MCREDAVEYLSDMDALEHDIIEECQWDSYDETREWVKSRFAKDNS